MLRRVDVEHAAAKHGDRPPARLHRPTMGGGVDPPGQAAHDRVAGAGEAGAELFGDLEAIRGGMPRADDGHRERILRQKRATNEEQSWRIVDP